MNPYLVTHQQAQTLVGAGVNIECVPTQEIDGISYVDLRDINTYRKAPSPYFRTAG